MDNNFCESKRNLSSAPQETELGSVPVSQWPSPVLVYCRDRFTFGVVSLTAVYLAYTCEATTAKEPGEIPGSKTGPMEEEAGELYGAVKLAEGHRGSSREVLASQG